MNHYMGNTYNGPKHNVFALMTILAVAKALWMVFTGTLCLMMPLDRLGLMTARRYRLALLAESIEQGPGCGGQRTQVSQRNRTEALTADWLTAGQWPKE